MSFSPGAPKPFLKWVGGKRRLLGPLGKAVDALPSLKGYHEPFIGGGALFFALTQRSAAPTRFYLSDVNGALIDGYIAVRDDVDAVIEALERHESAHSREYFYELRATHPESRVERAARLMYLNKTCYNGLYRVNSKGEFNAPFGRYKNPRIVDAENLQRVSRVLKQVRIAKRDFTTVTRYAKVDDLVYFDPPYIPVSPTADFTAYSANRFGMAQQRELAQVALALAQKGVHVMLSNSMTALTRELYRDFNITKVHVGRAVNSKGSGRGKVEEALVTSF